MARWVAALLLAALAIAPGAIAWYVNGPPVPATSDEYSYLFQARTFAAGRLSNPPVDPRYFGSMFLLTQPRFAVKFQPGQGMLLAVGKRILGHEYAGVLISVAMLTVSLWWMTLGLASARHAALIGLFAALRFGLFHEWSTSYWGGALPCSGAALAVGAWSRLRKGWHPGSAATLATGASILMFTRPFEGGLLIALLLLELAWQRVRPSIAAVGAFAVVMATAFALQATYDYAVTGKPALMPYVHYSNRYQQTPFSWLLPVPPEKTFPNEHMRLAHAVFEMEDYRQIVERGPIARAKFIIDRFRTSLAAGLPTWAMPLLLLAALAWRDRLVRVLVTIALAITAVLLCETWLYPHYLAGLFPVLFALIARSAYVSGERFGRPNLVLAICAAALLIPTLRWAGPAYSGPYLQRIRVAGPDAFARRARMEGHLTAMGGRHIIFVDYDYSREGLDWTYNEPIPQDSAIVWTRAIDPESDRRLREELGERTCWKLNAHDPSADIQPCD